LYRELKHRYDPRCALKPRCYIPSADWAPLADLKVGPEAAPIPLTFAPELRDVDATPGGDTEARSGNPSPQTLAPRPPNGSLPCPSRHADRPARFLEPSTSACNGRATPQPESVSQNSAGRICYMSQHNPANRSTARLPREHQEAGHGSVLSTRCTCSDRGNLRSCSHDWCDTARVRLLPAVAAYVTSHTPPSSCRRDAGRPALEANWEKA